ncbi:heme exporter protein CcmD [Porphyrobacter sp. AAP82]|nr:heme exporter protein CcmD [Porphyrobacter sp. AAP82]
MREALDQWFFVWLAYGVSAVALIALVFWARRAMVRAETRRDATRRR